MISVSILADSINPAGNRITSWLLTYPRFIHSEFMTHRAFSRNAASSRAIPLRKMLDAVSKEPALPERWGAEQKGMQSGDEVEGVPFITNEWLMARNECLRTADYLSGRGLHKSLCNRLIEPWAHITVLATATDHRNFFALRAHPAAMPEFQVLAYRMLKQYLEHDPRKVAWGKWHIPQFEFKTDGQRWTENPSYIDLDSDEDSTQRLKIATARCARLSYLTFDGNYSPEKDIELHDRLAASGHWSPFEHCAQAVNGDEPAPDQDRPQADWSNFDVGGEWSGWLQYRKLFLQENKTAVDLHEVLQTKPEWIIL